MLETVMGCPVKVLVYFRTEAFPAGVNGRDCSYDAHQL